MTFQAQTALESLFLMTLNLEPNSEVYRIYAFRNA
jgi:hypothetical protein